MGAVRVEERVLAAFGGLLEAPTRFEPGRDVSYGGVLWALPASDFLIPLHRSPWTVFIVRPFHDGDC